jgi:hypothetical protein
MSGNIFFKCPHCKEELKLPPDLAEPGDRIECPACNETITVPDSGLPPLQRLLPNFSREQWEMTGLISASVIILLVAAAGFVLPRRRAPRRKIRKPRPAASAPAPRPTPRAPRPPEPAPPAVEPEIPDAPPAVSPPTPPPVETVEEPPAVEPAPPGKAGSRMAADLSIDERRTIFTELMDADRRAGEEAEKRYPDDAAGEGKKGGSGQKRKRTQLQLALLGQYMHEVEVKFDLASGQSKTIWSEGVREGWDGTDDDFVFE